MKFFSATTLLLFFQVFASDASAHPETGFLPDAIAEVEYKMVVEINPRDLSTRNRLGIVLLRKNKLKEAENQFAEVLKLAPKDFDAHDGMGLVRSRMGDFQGAISWFHRGATLAATDTMVRYNLGSAYEQTGRLKEALAAYRQALEVNGQNLSRGLNRDLETEKRKKIDAALQALSGRMKKGK